MSADRNGRGVASWNERTPEHAHPRDRGPRKTRRGHAGHPSQGRTRGDGRRPAAAGLRAGGSGPVRPGRSDRRRACRGRPARPRRRRPRGRDPQPGEEPAARDPPDQPHGDQFHPGGRRTVRRAALRAHLQRDRAGVLVPQALLPRRVRAHRRTAPRGAAGHLCAVEVVRRTAHGRRRRPVRPDRGVGPADVGPVGGQHRAQRRPHRAGTGRGHERLVLVLRRRRRPGRPPARRRDRRDRWPRGRLRRSLGQRQRPAAGTTWSVGTSGTRSGCGRCRGPTLPGSPA